MNESQNQRPTTIYICDWLPPDFGAVGQYAVYFSRMRCEQGRDVTLVGLNSDAGSVTDERVAEATLRTIRVHRPAYDKGRFLKRIAWTIGTNVRLLWAARESLSMADEVVFTGSPPLMLHFIAPLNAFFWRRKLTYRITDFHPECLIAELGRRPWPLHLLAVATRFWRRRIHRFEALGQDQVQRLLDQGIKPDRIAVVRDPSPVAFAADTCPLDKPAELRGLPTILYSGNWGVAHDHQTFLDGWIAHQRRGGRPCGLWLNAVGAKADQVQLAAEAAGMPVARTRPVPIEQLPSVLLAADLHLISLRDEFVGYVLPSKVHACVKSSRPVLFVGSASSDVHDICGQGVEPGRYFRVDVGDKDGVTNALDRWLETLPA